MTICSTQVKIAQNDMNKHVHYGGNPEFLDEYFMAYLDLRNKIVYLIYENPTFGILYVTKLKKRS